MSTHQNTQEHIVVNLSKDMGQNMVNHLPHKEQKTTCKAAHQDKTISCSTLFQSDWQSLCFVVAEGKVPSTKIFCLWKDFACLPMQFVLHKSWGVSAQSHFDYIMIQLMSEPPLISAVNSRTQTIHFWEVVWGTTRNNFWNQINIPNTLSILCVFRAHWNFWGDGSRPVSIYMMVIGFAFQHRKASETVAPGDPVVIGCVFLDSWFACACACALLTPSCGVTFVFLLKNNAWQAINICCHEKGLLLFYMPNQVLSGKIPTAYCPSVLFVPSETLFVLLMCTLIEIWLLLDVSLFSLMFLVGVCGVSLLMASTSFFPSFSNVVSNPLPVGCLPFLQARFFKQEVQRRLSQAKLNHKLEV